MNKLFIQTTLFIFLSLLYCLSGFAEEMYIISTRDGSQIIVQEYSFTDERVEFTTGNGLPGFIRREDFVGIANMVGELPATENDLQAIEKQKQQELQVWLLAAALLIFLYILFMLYVMLKKKGGRDGSSLEKGGRIAMIPKTQGHLSFRYKEFAGRKTDWTIEVRNAYQEDGVLFVEGVSMQTGESKTFRADKIVGMVTDVSSSREAGMDVFFKEEEF